MNNPELKDLIEESKNYIEAKFDLYKLKMAEHSSEAFAKLMGAFILAGFFLLFMVALSFFLGMLFSDLMGSNIAGFGTIAGLYLAILLILFLKRKSLLIKPLQNSAIQTLFKDEAKDKN